MTAWTLAIMGCSGSRGSNDDVATSAHLTQEDTATQETGATSASPTGDRGADTTSSEGTAGPGGVPRWQQLEIPVVLGEFVADVVAGDEAIWVTVTSFEGGRVLTQVDGGDWETYVADLPGYDLERARDGGVWMASAETYAYARLELGQAPEIVSVDAAQDVWSVWVGPSRVLGFGIYSFGFGGWISSIDGGDPFPLTFTSTPTYAVSEVDGRVFLGNQSGISLFPDEIAENADRVGWPCGEVDDFHPHGADVLAAIETGAIARFSDGDWSFSPVGANRVVEIASRGQIAWSSGDALGVMVDDVWERLDELGAPTETRAISVSEDGTLYVAAGDNELWRRTSGPPQTAAWGATTSVSLTLDNERIEPTAAWIGRDGGEISLYVAFDDPEIGSRIFVVDYGVTGSVDNVSVSNGFEGTTNNMPGPLSEIMIDLETRYSEGTAIDPGNTVASQYSVTWSGTFPRWG